MWQGIDLIGAYGKVERWNAKKVWLYENFCKPVPRKFGSMRIYVNAWHESLCYLLECIQHLLHHTAELIAQLQVFVLFFILYKECM